MNKKFESYDLPKNNPGKLVAVLALNVILGYILYIIGSIVLYYVGFAERIPIVLLGAGMLIPTLAPIIISRFIHVDSMKNLAPWKFLIALFNLYLCAISMVFLIFELEGVLGLAVMLPLIPTGFPAIVSEVFTYASTGIVIVYVIGLFLAPYIAFTNAFTVDFSKKYKFEDGIRREGKYEYSIVKKFPAHELEMADFNTTEDSLNTLLAGGTKVVASDGKPSNALDLYFTASGDSIADETVAYVVVNVYTFADQYNAVYLQLNKISYKYNKKKKTLEAEMKLINDNDFITPLKTNVLAIEEIAQASSYADEYAAVDYSVEADDQVVAESDEIVEEVSSEE